MVERDVYLSPRTPLHLQIIIKSMCWIGEYVWPCTYDRSVPFVSFSFGVVLIDSNDISCNWIFHKKPTPEGCNCGRAPLLCAPPRFRTHIINNGSLSDTGQLYMRDLEPLHEIQDFKIHLYFYVSNFTIIFWVCKYSRLSRFSEFSDNLVARYREIEFFERDPPHVIDLPTLCE